MGAGEGTFEVERRYLVRVRDGLWATLGEGSRLQQGYVAAGRSSVRIRLGEPRGPVLTCKSGAGVRRREVEAVVPEPLADALLEASGGRRIEKIRHRLGRWELDRFGGGLEGLVLMEVELDREDEPIPDPPDGVVIIREVTDDNHFTNQGLACMTPKAQRELVRAVQEETSKW
jgi:CYTH domain-containing protein